jgi:flagellar biosynthesis chaperone FliJ
MKRFQFQLEKLLRYHQQRQKQAELLLSRAAREQESAQAAVRELERRIDLACQLPERVGRSIEPVLREQSLRHAQQLCETLPAVQETLKAAERRFREAQRHHTAVTQQVEALLHLRSQRWQEHLDEAARQQQIALDDVVMKQWSRRALGADSTFAESESTAVIGDQRP